MNNEVITRDSFEALLMWLGPTRDEGAQKYETVRDRLIRIFAKKGCTEAEDLADITINRVIGKLSTIRLSYVGDPANYFCGVARLVYFEWRRRKEIAVDSVPATTCEPVLDRARECLRTCLSSLTVEQRNLILDYYIDETKTRIQVRQQLATELGVSTNALRLRAHRLRSGLEECVLECLRYS